MAWDDIDNELKQRLIETRRNIGLLRQSQLSTDFQNLMAIFSTNSTLPFNQLEHNVFDALNSACPFFKEGGHWQAADLSDSNHFYRVETLESFLKKHLPYIYRSYDDHDKVLLSPRINTPGTYFDSICTDYLDKGEKWLQLSRLTSAYFSYRNFSWWTNDYDFEKEGKITEIFDGPDLTQQNKWLLEFAFKVGITSDWLSPHMLFLRLDRSMVNEEDIRVPSVIDALLQPIFSPQQPVPAQRWGLAFNLNNDIKPKNKEYVLRNVPVDAISYFPVKLDQDTFDLVNAKARLRNEMVEALIDNI